MPDTMPYEKWVAHCPYPDGTFRGLEKCTDVGFKWPALEPTLDPAHLSSPVMLDTKEEIEEYIKAHDLKGFVPVCVHVITPVIRGALTALERES